MPDLAVLYMRKKWADNRRLVLAAQRETRGYPLSPELIAAYAEVGEAEANFRAAMDAEFEERLKSMYARLASMLGASPAEAEGEFMAYIHRECE